MRNRINVICLASWAFMLGLKMNATDIPTIGLVLYGVITALYGASVWTLASLADKATKELEEKETNENH